MRILRDYSGHVFRIELRRLYYPSPVQVGMVVGAAGLNAKSLKVMGALWTFARAKDRSDVAERRVARLEKENAGDAKLEKARAAREETKIREQRARTAYECSKAALSDEQRRDIFFRAGDLYSEREARAEKICESRTLHVWEKRSVRTIVAVAALSSVLMLTKNAQGAAAGVATAAIGLLYLAYKTAEDVVINAYIKARFLNRLV